MIHCQSLLAVVLLLGLLAENAQAQRGPGRIDNPRGNYDSPNPVDPATIRAVIDQLDSPSYREREEAGRKLQGFGGQAIPLMKEALRTKSSPEIQERLKFLIFRMVEINMLEPTRLNLSLKDATARSAIRELSKVSGYNLQGAALPPSTGPEKASITLEMKNRSFWEIVMEIEKQGKFWIEPAENYRALYSTELGTVNPHMFSRGPYRFVLRNLYSSRSLQFKGKNGFTRSNGLTLEMEVHSEPKLCMSWVSLLEVSSARDDLGTLLVCNIPERSPDSRIDTSENPTHNFSLDLFLTQADRKASKISELTGKVKIASVVTSQPIFTIEKILDVKQKKKLVGKDRDLEVLSVNHDEKGRGTTIEIAIHSHGADRKSPLLTTGLAQTLILLDEKGNQFECLMGQMNAENGRLVYRSKFEAPHNRKFGKPYQLQFLEFETRTREVEFHFKDIPLP